MVDELDSLRERAYGGTGAPLTPAEASSQWQVPNGTLASRDRVTARAD